MSIIEDLGCNVNVLELKDEVYQLNTVEVLNKPSLEVRLLHYIMVIEKKRYIPPEEEPPDSGWKWHYSATCKIYNYEDMNKPILTIGYSVDEHWYMGVYVPEGFKYRVYGPNGCAAYGIKTLDQAIEQCNGYLDNAIDMLTLAIKGEVAR